MKLIDRLSLTEALQIIWPLALAQMAGATNHICDRLFLAHSGDAVLEASLPALMVSTLVCAFFTATIGYSSTFVAQLHGGGHGREAVKAFAQGLYLAGFAIPVFALLVPVAFGIIDFAAHADSVNSAEKAYLAIHINGGVFQTLNAVLGGLLTGQGKTRFVSAATIGGCLLNIALDPLLIFGCGPIAALGITGAATASVLGTALTTALLAAATARDPLVRANRDALRLDGVLLRRILRFGSPIGLTAFAGCLAFTVFTLVIGRLDDLSSAASTTVFTVNNVFYLALCSTSEGICILTGRHHGAGDEGATRRAFVSGLLIVGTALVACFAVILPMSGSIMDLFRGANSTFDPAHYRTVGSTLFLFMFVREIAESVLCLTNGALRGVGDTKFVMRTQVLCDLFIWTPSVLLVYVFTNSLYALWLTMPLNLGLMGFLLIRRWRSGAWRTGRLT